MTKINIDWSQLVTSEMTNERAQNSLIAQYEQAVQSHIDLIATKRGYANGFALAGYIASTIPAWSSEALAFVTWRDVVWLYAQDELDKVKTGKREIPTIEDFIEELPEMKWETE